MSRTVETPRPVFPAGYEPENRDRSTYTHDDGTDRYGLGYATTHSYGWGQEKLWDGDTYLGGHEVKDGYGTRSYAPAKPYTPPAKTWRNLPWNSQKSAECANSDNLFVRLYGVYRDAQQNFWSCSEHRHYGVRGGAGCLPVVLVDGHAMVLLSHRAGFTQHGGTWSTFGGAIDKGETPFKAAVRETFEEISGIPHGGKVASKLVRSCEHCGWRYTTYVVILDIDPRDLHRVRGKGSETRGVAWVPLYMVKYYDLHPAFAQAWPELQRVVRGLEG